MQSNDPMVRRKYWLKKVKDTKEIENEEEKEKGNVRRPREPKKAKIDYEMKFQV